MTRFEVTDIAFDFSDDLYDEEITDEYKEELRDGVFGTIWDADTLTREEKFQVFCRVCDNMLKDGRMTKTTHKRFTEIW